MSERETKYTSVAKSKLMTPISVVNSSGGKAGGVLKNKVPFVAALSALDVRTSLARQANTGLRFTSKAIADWAKANLTPGCASAF